MSISKDEVLRMIFDGVAMRTAGDRGAAKILHEGSVYYACPSAVYIGQPSADEQKMAENKVYPYSNELKLLHITDIRRLNPEVLLDVDRLSITKAVSDKFMQGKYKYVVPVAKAPDPKLVGMWLMTKVNGNGILYDVMQYENCPRLMELPVYAYAFPPELHAVLTETKVPISALQGAFMRGKLNNVISCMLTGDTAQLCLTLVCFADSADMLRNITDMRTSLKYTADGWNEKTKEFKRVVKMKGNNMKSLLNPLRKEQPAQVQPAQVSTPVSTVIDHDQASDSPAAAISTTADAPVGSVGVVEEIVGDKAPEPEQAALAAVEPQPAVQEEKPKHTRSRKAATGVGYDYTGVLEALGAPVADITDKDFDKAVEELRSLRDVLIGAARRSCNIALQIQSMSKGAVDKMAALQSILKNTI